MKREHEDDLKEYKEPTSPEDFVERIIEHCNPGSPVNIPNLLLDLSYLTSGRINLTSDSQQELYGYLTELGQLRIGVLAIPVVERLAGYLDKAAAGQVDPQSMVREIQLLRWFGYDNDSEIQEIIDQITNKYSLRPILPLHPDLNRSHPPLPVQKADEKVNISQQGTAKQGDELMATEESNEPTIPANNLSEAAVNKIFPPGYITRQLGPGRVEPTPKTDTNKLGSKPKIEINPQKRRLFFINRLKDPSKEIHWEFDQEAKDLAKTLTADELKLMPDSRLISMFIQKVTLDTSAVAGLHINLHTDPKYIKYGLSMEKLAAVISEEDDYETNRNRVFSNFRGIEMDHQNQPDLWDKIRVYIIGDLARMAAGSRCSDEFRKDQIEDELQAKIISGGRVYTQNGLKSMHTAWIASILLFNMLPQSKK